MFNDYVDFHLLTTTKIIYLWKNYLQDLPKRIVYAGFGYASSILTTFFCRRCFHFYSAIDSFLFILNDQNLKMRASQTEKYQNSENLKFCNSNIYDGSDQSSILLNMLMWVVIEHDPLNKKSIQVGMNELLQTLEPWHIRKICGKLTV